MVVSEYFCGLLTGKTRISDEKSWEVPLEFGDWEEYEAALDLLFMEGTKDSNS